MKSVGMLLVVVALCVISVSRAAKLFAVEAGPTTEIVDIGRLRRGGAKGSQTVELCPEKYPNGFSIECREDYPGEIDPSGGVKFFVNGDRAQTEWISPPYMIAGDKDRPPNGLTEIGSWTDWMDVNNCVRKRNKDCTLRIKCTYKNGQVNTKRIVILAEGCYTGYFN